MHARLVFPLPLCPGYNAGMSSDEEKPRAALLWAEFWRKLTAYVCIFVGLVGISTPIFGSLLLTCALNLSGVAWIVGGIWWLIRLRRRFG